MIITVDFLKNTLPQLRALHKFLGEEIERREGNTIDSPLSEQERKLALLPGRAINAIRAHRSRTGVDLKEAKDIVDAYRVAHGIPRL